MQEDEKPQTEYRSNECPDPVYRYIKIGLFVSVLILLGSWGMYIWKVGSSFSSDSGDWSDFGGFLGGIGSAIGPTLTVAGLLFVWWQGKQGDKQNSDKIEKINDQNQALKDTLEELRNQTEIQKKHITILENQQVRAQYDSMLSSIFEASQKQSKNHDFNVGELITPVVRNIENADLRELWIVDFGSFLSRVFEAIYLLEQWEKVYGKLIVVPMKYRLQAELTSISISIFRLLKVYAETELFCLYPEEVKRFLWFVGEEVK